MDQDKRKECRKREQHGRATEPRFEITLPKDEAAEVFGSLLGEDPKESG